MPSKTLKRKSISTELVDDPATKLCLDTIRERLDRLQEAFKKTPYFSPVVKSYSNNSASTYTQVDLFTLEMQTYGNPVDLRFQPIRDEYGSEISIALAGVGGSIAAIIGIKRDGEFIGTQRVFQTNPGTDGVLSLPPSTFTWTDQDVPPGQHTYTVWIYVPVSSITLSFTNVRLMAIEV